MSRAPSVWWKPKISAGRGNTGGPNPAGKWERRGQRSREESHSSFSCLSVSFFPFLVCLLSSFSASFPVCFCSLFPSLCPFVLLTPSLSCFLFFPHYFLLSFIIFFSFLFPFLPSRFSYLFISPFSLFNCFSILLTFIFISSFLICLPSKPHTHPSSRLFLFLFFPSPPSFGPLSFCTTSSAFFLSSPPRPLLSLPPHPLLFSSLHDSGRTKEVCVCMLACCTAVSLRSMFYYYHHHLFSV